MSELKTFDSQRIYWAVEQVERVAGDIDEVHLDDNLFYLKSEADEVIAKLNNRIKFLQVTHSACCNHCNECADGMGKVFDETLDELKKQKLVEQTTLRVWAELQLRHNKYKRCLNMANWCFTRSNFFFVVGRSEGGRFAEERFRRSDLYLKWCDRWQRLAEQFKENK